MISISIARAEAQRVAAIKQRAFEEKVRAESLGFARILERNIDDKISKAAENGYFFCRVEIELAKNNLISYVDEGENGIKYHGEEPLWLKAVINDYRNNGYKVEYQRVYCPFDRAGCAEYRIEWD